MSMTMTYLTQLVEDVDDLVAVFSPLELVLIILNLRHLLLRLRAESQREARPVIHLRHFNKR